jgi:hypothetical protein
MAWHESAEDITRRNAAAAVVGFDMRVKVVESPKHLRRAGGWELHRGRGIVAIAQYKYRNYVPKDRGFCWKLDSRKVREMKRRANELGVPALFFIETCGSEDMRGVHLTYRYITGTVLRDDYRQTTLTLNVERDEGDRNDPVFEIPDREMQSLHLLADKLWPNTAPHFRSQIEARLAAAEGER